ncbi:MAG: hypothetical protein ABIT20_04010 [Gemmatimonadaceae bacterium]
MDDITWERRRAAFLRVKVMECARFAGWALRAFVILAALAQPSLAQAVAPVTGADSTPTPRDGQDYWRDFAAGFAASLLAHESAHVVTSYAVGSHPSFGFDTGRPTVYSNIDVDRYPGKQFLFSSMGLNVQAALDEAILDVPHARGAAFERGVLASGIATALFYITIGRTASVSDVDFMARTSSLSKAQIALIYGGVAALHTFRISRDSHYADFFVRPSIAGDRGLRVGVNVQP